MHKEEQILKELTEIIKKYDLTIFGGKEGMLYYSVETDRLEGDEITIHYDDDGIQSLSFD